MLRSAAERVPYVYHDTAEATVVGLGCAAEVTAREGETLRECVDHLRDALELEPGDDGTRRALQLPFEVAFDPCAPPGDAWSTFERIRLTCPAMSLTWTGDGLDVVHVRTGREDTHPAEAVLEKASRSDSHSRSAHTGTCHTTAPHLDAYREAVERAIDAPSVEKAVIARTLDVEIEHAPGPAEVIEALKDRHPEGRHVAIAPNADGPVFLGASPERLVRLDGDRARTMALAGTAERDSAAPDTAIHRLMQSDKERSEHAYVVKMITETLADLGAEVQAPETPRAAFTPDVVHLETPISAEVPSTIELADLVDALHPTPAVCGTPTDAARRLIGELEPFDRGLYAGAVGWMNLHGEGEATVALRCGLLEDGGARLFAGGGITRNSDVEDELEETCSKFQPLLLALREASR